LKQFPIEGELTAKGKQKFWGKGAIEKFLKDPTNDVEDLPDGVKDVWLDWQEEYPEPTYEDVDRDLMIKYGGEDIITMLEFFQKAMKFIIKRNQLPILELESKCILPMYRMERVGLKVDMDYLEQSRTKVKSYITKLRNEMYELVGERVTVNQHEKIKDIFREKWSIHLDSDDAKAMKEIMEEKLFEEVDDFDWDNKYIGKKKIKIIITEEAKRLAELIKSLRSYEKWYSTYILRIQKNAAYDGRLYTQLNSAGAVSGRMSCDVQQFPKGALKTLEGEELFHPRKAFTIKGGSYESIAYIDYDQIELVTQAHYTLLVSGGDLNLCRAYMPFKCRHYLTNDEYNYKDRGMRARWSELQPDGLSAWLDEQGKPWVKTDTHSMTAHKAFPEVPMDHPDFKKVYRPKGKTTNFAANYGATPKALVGQGFSWEDAERLIKGYNEAFPGVIQYQKAIIKAHELKGYVHNHFGRRYYLSDAYRAYTLGNHVVQGTCADALKRAIIELDEYLMDKKTNMVIPIHDEVQFDVYKGEEWVIAGCEKIMQKAFDWCLVPVTAGVEVTYTTWSDKKEME
jgi:DNA polymerase-1